MSIIFCLIIGGSVFAASGDSCASCWDVVCNYVFMEGEYNSWMTLFITIFVLILD